MTVVSLFSSGENVKRVSVQVSEYSAANGGSDGLTFYKVEVLFPDGKWEPVFGSTSLDAARLYAATEASDRGALLLKESCWPNRKVLKA